MVMPTTCTQQLNDLKRKTYNTVCCNTSSSRPILSASWTVDKFLAGAASEAAFLCLRPVSARLVVLLLYLPLASAAEQLLSLALSGWVAVTSRDLCHQPQTKHDSNL